MEGRTGTVGSRELLRASALYRLPMKEYIVFLAKWTFTDRPITNTRASGPTRFHKQPLPRTPFPTCLYSFTAKADSRVRVESITLSYCPTVITPAPAPCHNTSGQSELTHGKALCEHQTSFSSSPKFLGSHSTAFVELAPCLPQRKILGHVSIHPASQVVST